VKARRRGSEASAGVVAVAVAEIRQAARAA